MTFAAPSSPSCALLDLRGLTWTKSSHSGGGGNCVEVATRGYQRYVRDSKNPDGPVLTFTQQAFIRFIAVVVAGEYDHVTEPPLRAPGL
ncbi:DUF397 domain-containing protein [Kitasatospora sp. NPDC088779]|uniref:DUF397 domain-containing protein n=1 Tax=unclassified Kitasatospora TaxID=2633591 RepID=UPI0034228681